MRIRTIKPEFWTSEDLARLSESAFILAAALLNYADDDGYFNANPAIIRGALFPLRELLRPIADCLAELAEVSYCDFATGIDGKRYGRVRNFRKHQVVAKPSRSRIAPLWPTQEPMPEGSGRATVGLPEPSSTPPGGNGREVEVEREVEGRVERKPTAALPHPADITAPGRLVIRTPDLFDPAPPPRPIPPEGHLPRLGALGLRLGGRTVDEHALECATAVEIIREHGGARCVAAAERIRHARPGSSWYLGDLRAELARTATPTTPDPALAAQVAAAELATAALAAVDRLGWRVVVDRLGLSVHDDADLRALLCSNRGAARELVDLAAADHTAAATPEVADATCAP